MVEAVDAKRNPREKKGVTYDCLVCGAVGVVQTWMVEYPEGLFETRRVTTVNGRKPCKKSANGKHIISGV